jgi:hypothetical protein
MIDRLDAKHLVRWMAHRDLVLWYRELGKLDLAEKQKQILFELVGLNDDRILYPKKRRMGRLVWWLLTAMSMGCACGMA